MIVQNLQQLTHFYQLIVSTSISPTLMEILNNNPINYILIKNVRGGGGGISYPKGLILSFYFTNYNFYSKNANPLMFPQNPH